MIAELALALVLLVGSGLMIKSFLRLLAVPKGFNPDGLLTLALAKPRQIPAGVATTPRLFTGIARSRSIFARHPIRQPDRVPSARRAALACCFRSKAARRLSGEKSQVVEVNHISPDYFQTMGAQCAQDDLSPRKMAQSAAGSDHQRNAGPSLLPQREPDRPQVDHSGSITKTIAGVAGDTRHLGLDREVHPEVYFPTYNIRNS